MSSAFNLYSQKASFTIDTAQGCGKLTVIFKNTSKGFNSSATYLWNFGDNSNSNDTGSVIHTYDSIGIFHPKLTVTYGEDPDYKTSVFTDSLRVRPKPNAYFNGENYCTKGNLHYTFTSVVQLEDSINYAYDWTINPGKSGEIDVKHSSANQPSSKTDILDHVFTSTGIDSVRLIMIDYFGCADTVTQQFFVSDQFAVPEVFTPNGDGINDYFYVPTNGRTVYSLKIFTRAGILIYKNTSTTILWDGNLSSGDKALPGTYFYVIEPVQISSPADSGDLQNKKAGFVVLIRDKNDMNNNTPLYRPK
jgi:gliding motility-associated-like protein